MPLLRLCTSSEEGPNLFNYISFRLVEDQLLITHEMRCDFACPFSAFPWTFAGRYFLMKFVYGHGNAGPPL
jgi:hypothetical protein